MITLTIYYGPHKVVRAGLTNRTAAEITCKLDGSKELRVTGYKVIAESDKHNVAYIVRLIQPTDTVCLSHFR